MFGSADLKSNSESFHGIVICDECEAIWLEPDLNTVHQYPDIDRPASPVTGQPLWTGDARWADFSECEALGWQHAINRDLDGPSADGPADVPERPLI